MTTVIVKTQAELNAALDRDEPYLDIEIRSERGVWLELSRQPKGRSASVSASGSASVRASGSASVRAFDSASVSASGSASVRASGSASVTATPNVAVHLHSASVKVTGGVLIDVSKPLTDAAEWCEHHGVEVSKSGVATVYKAVDDNYLSGRGQSYAPGTKPTCPDWRDNNDCGNGFHFSPSPGQAQYYYEDATRFLAVGVKLSDLRPIPGGVAKCKAPAVVRKCVEVDVHGKPVTA